MPLKLLDKDLSCVFIHISQHIDNVMVKIESGYRMECPDGCPVGVYDVMKDCWDITPNQRPTFQEIYKTLERFHQSFLPDGN